MFKCDGEFNILHTFWYYPVHLLSPYQKTLAVLFSPADMERIAGMAAFVLVIIWGVAASRGERVKIPFITDFLQKMKWA